MIEEELKGHTIEELRQWRTNEQAKLETLLDMCYYTRQLIKSLNAVIGD